MGNINPEEIGTNNVDETYVVKKDTDGFIINNDGTVTRRVKSPDDKPGKPGKSGQRNTAFIVIILAFVVLSAVLGFTLYKANQRIESLTNTIAATSNDLDEARLDNDRTQKSLTDIKADYERLESESSSFKTRVGNKYPIIITDIEIANTYKSGTIETDYGKSIYSSSTMYITPRIKYYGISSGDKTYKVKFYMPDGKLSTGSSSPSGFSYSNSRNVYTGPDNTMTLDGWGGENRGHWRSGSYRLEIWYNDVCLGVKYFTIYS